MEALYDLANGCRVWAKTEVTGRNSGGQEMSQLIRISKEARESANEAGIREGWIYLRPPDVSALRTILQYNIGLPKSQQEQKFAPVIEFRHHIPGKRDWIKPREDSETSAPILKDDEAPFPEQILEESRDRLPPEPDHIPSPGVGDG